MSQKHLAQSAERPLAEFQRLIDWDIQRTASEDASRSDRVFSGRWPGPSTALGLCVNGFQFR